MKPFKTKLTLITITSINGHRPPKVLVPHPTRVYTELHVCTACYTCATHLHMDNKVTTVWRGEWYTVQQHFSSLYLCACGYVCVYVCMCVGLCAHVLLWVATSILSTLGAFEIFMMVAPLNRSVSLVTVMTDFF